MLSRFLLFGRTVLPVMLLFSYSIGESGTAVWSGQVIWPIVTFDVVIRSSFLPSVVGGFHFLHFHDSGTIVIVAFRVLAGWINTMNRLNDHGAVCVFCADTGSRTGCWVCTGWGSIARKVENFGPGLLGAFEIAGGADCENCGGHIYEALLEEGRRKFRYGHLERLDGSEDGAV
jgi:hypothetical protein